ncbi:MAG TPA: crosslink repair DNA glycosylase YcaQ family protein [Candidatus Acidoferrales bacterium]|nr:crosslink repair DNA glycosylase YcaQ family protein [Candidatus Acidoferrales bacterium]
MRVTLSLSEARRLAIDSQAFGKKPPATSIAHLRKLAARLHAFQIDSVNVLARAHYVPAFARLGPYPMDALDALAYQKRELFEYWGHAACLLPVSLYPLVRYRMHKHAERTQDHMRSERGSYMAEVYAEVAERGPLTAAELSNPGKRSGGWWGWWGTGNGKATLEHLYDAGMVAIAGRRGFERLYDITPRVIPRAALDAQPPPREEAMKRLICLAAKACGVGTSADLAGYFDVDGWRDRLPPGPGWERPKGPDGQRSRPIVKRLMSELIEEARLLPVRVEGWKEQAYLCPHARVPRSVDARAFVTPFDSLVWERGRMERLFGMKYTIEMYTPPAKRIYGYYVCPFLLGDTLVARCDLKADRERKTLIVQGAFLEPGQAARRVAPELAGELRQMQSWLALDRIEVKKRGDLAAMLRRSVSDTSEALT